MIHKILYIDNYYWLEKIMNKKWFTLVEMLVAITILSIIMLSIFVIYRNIIYVNKKLELDRIIQENARNITENLATEIREKGIDYSYYSPLTEKLDYNWNWNTILAIKNSWEYCMQKQNNYCSKDCYKDSKSCYLWKMNTDINLSDDRVKIDNLKFYIIWDNTTWLISEQREWKVTIVFDLSIAPWKWISSELIKDSSIHIQTTISSKFYKNMN